MLWVLNCQYVKTLMGEKSTAFLLAPKLAKSTFFDSFFLSPETKGRGLQAVWCPPETQGEGSILGSVLRQVANIRGNLTRHQGDIDSIPNRDASQ